MPEASVTVIISVMRSIVTESMVVVVVLMSKAVAVVTELMSISMTVVEVMELSFIPIVSFCIA
jgi:hypothetical protein